MTLLRDLSQADFGHLFEQYRRELQVHCYRILASLEDAQDMVQETFLRAWQRRETYTEDISARAWFYRIATNLCLDDLRKQRRRMIPKTGGERLNPTDPIPAAIVEPIWMEPYPDDLLLTDETDPEQRLLSQESVSIAFLAVLQLLPPRQRVVLLCSDVLGWKAEETAATLNTTVSAVKSALHRARATIIAERARFEMTPQPPAATMFAQLAAYLRAWEEADSEALIRLLRDDATFSMPPIPSWYQGREAIRGLVSKTVFGGDARGRWRLLPTRANGQIAFGLYRRSETGAYAAYGIQVLTFAGDLLVDIITFRIPKLVVAFGLAEMI